LAHGGYARAKHCVHIRVDHDEAAMWDERERRRRCATPGEAAMSIIKRYDHGRSTIRFLTATAAFAITTALAIAPAMAADFEPPAAAPPAYEYRPYAYPPQSYPPDGYVPPRYIPDHYRYRRYGHVYGPYSDPYDPYRKRYVDRAPRPPAPVGAPAWGGYPPDYPDDGTVGAAPPSYEWPPDQPPYPR
jgi:hypothetical protein